MKAHLRYNSRWIFGIVFAICLSIVVLLRTSLTTRGEFFHCTGLQLPQDATLVKVVHPPYDDFSSDGGSLIEAKVTATLVETLISQPPPWSRGDWRHGILDDRYLYTLAKTSDELGLRLKHKKVHYDIRSDGEMDYSLLVVTDDGTLVLLNVHF